MSGKVDNMKSRSVAVTAKAQDGAISPWLVLLLVIVANLLFVSMCKSSRSALGDSRSSDYNQYQILFDLNDRKGN